MRPWTGKESIWLLFGQMCMAVSYAAGIEPELCRCAAAVHDYGRILTGKQKDHAEAGYEPVKRFLKEVGTFHEEEIEIIAHAVKKITA